MVPGRLPQIQIKQNIIVALEYLLLPFIEFSFGIRLLLGHIFPSRFDLTSFNINALEYAGSATERATQLQSTGMLPGTSTQICYLASTALNSDWLISTELFEFTTAAAANF